MKRYRVVSDASVLGQFDSANAAAAYRDAVTIDGQRGRAVVQSWGIAPYWDGDWTTMDPQPRYNPWKCRAAKEGK